jgi:hypothetical protein
MRLTPNLCAARFTQTRPQPVVRNKPYTNRRKEAIAKQSTNFPYAEVLL